MNRGLCYGALNASGIQLKHSRCELVTSLLSFTKSGKFLVLVSSVIIFSSSLLFFSFCDSNYPYVRMVHIVPQVTVSPSLSTIFSFHFLDWIFSTLLSSSSLIFFSIISSLLLDSMNDFFFFLNFRYCIFQT